MLTSGTLNTLFFDAIAQWKRVLELDPQQVAAQKNIEMAERRKGN